MNIEIKESNGGYNATLFGWLDTNVATEFLEDLKTLEAHADKAIELDCSKLEYICSLGLRGLLKLQKLSVAQGGTLVLKNVNDEIRGILTLTGFIKLFVIR
jgi:anti-anti-sigma factor